MARTDAMPRSKVTWALLALLVIIVVAWFFTR
jgi:hypothetical protein